MKPQITTLADIFKRIEGRKWSWMGGKEEVVAFPPEGTEYKIRIDAGWFTLADLLVNRSWCEVVWGYEEYVKIDDAVKWATGKEKSKQDLKDKSYPKWKGGSIEVFQILQTDTQACLDYIGRTMV